MTKPAAAIRAKTVETRSPGRMHPPADGERRARVYKNRARAGVQRKPDAPNAGFTNRIMYRRGGFRKAKSISVGVLLDGHPVIHLIDAQDLRVPAVAAELVVLAHDQRLDRLGRANLRAQAAEAAARQVEIEVIEHFDLGAGLAMAPKRNQVVRARLRALVADDAGLRAALGLDLQPQHAAEARRGRTALRRVLERKRRLRRVLERDPEALEQVDQEDRLE